MTICQISTIDGSPKLERQVQKMMMQMKHQCPTLKAAGYFELGRNMILKVQPLEILFLAHCIYSFIFRHLALLSSLPSSWYNSIDKK